MAISVRPSGKTTRASGVALDRRSVPPSARVSALRETGRSRLNIGSCSKLEALRNSDPKVVEARLREVIRLDPRYGAPYLALRELPLTAGRLLGLGFFLGAHSYFGEAGLRAAIVTLGCSHMGIFLFLPREKRS